MLTNIKEFGNISVIDKFPSCKGIPKEYLNGDGNEVFPINLKSIIDKSVIRGQIPSPVISHFDNFKLDNVFDCRIKSKRFHTPASVIGLFERSRS